jgi:hypothetical protein
MRRIAEPDLERIVRQAAHTAHERIVEHDVPKQLTLDGLRSDVPYAYHYCKTPHCVTVHNASNYTSNSSCSPVGKASQQCLLKVAVKINYPKSQQIGTYSGPCTSSIFKRDKSSLFVR